eukprot:9539946-Alexandrium_andersonii.AAC.1
MATLRARGGLLLAEVFCHPWRARHPKPRAGPKLGTWVHTGTHVAAQPHLQWAGNHPDPGVRQPRPPHGRYSHAAPTSMQPHRPHAMGPHHRNNDAAAPPAGIEIIPLTAGATTMPQATALGKRLSVYIRRWPM